MSDFSSRSYDEDVPVLIVGGSVVGLSMALFLAQHGIAALLVEQHNTTSIHTRAGAFNARTLELFRQVGIESAILEQETPPEQLGEMGLRVESLMGKVLASTEAPSHRQANFINPFASPTRTAMIGQDKLEPILQKHASALGSDIRFGTELVQFEQSSEGINALIRERATGREYHIHAAYLVAADGNRSALRQQLGIDSYGYGTLGQWVSILFQTDLNEALQGRKVTLCFVNNATLDGIMGQSKDRWALFANLKPRPGERLDAPSEDYCLELVRAAIGIPDQPVKMISMLPWELASRVAERYQQQRVFLVGDAAHVMTTMGAFGANTGIADTHNLAWKLAFVLKKKAHENLLATYGQERQPAADLAVGVSTGLYAYRLPHHEQGEAITRSAEEMLMRVRKSPDAPQPTAFSVIYGYRYRSAAISQAHDDDNDNALFENEPSGRTGTRAPHIWLSHNGKQISILDLYGSNFVLLTGSNGQRWHETFAQVASRLGASIDRYSIGQDQSYRDDEGNFLASYGINASGAVLVRPDGFITWHAQNAADQPEGCEAIVFDLSRLLGYAPPL